MNVRAKSVALLLATLVVGLGVGALATGAAMNNRLDQLERLRDRRGFAERMEEVIQPVDDEQRARIREVLLRSQERFDEIRKTCRAGYGAAGDTMRAELGPLLTSDQQVRLDEYFSRDRRRPRGPSHRRPLESDREAPKPR